MPNTPPSHHYPKCPVSGCEYKDRGQPVRFRGPDAPPIEVLVSHRPKKQPHRSVVAVYPDGTQTGRVLRDDERFEDVTVVGQLVGSSTRAA